MCNPTQGPSEDKRSALMVAVVREDLALPAASLGWVDGQRQQLVDCLTKSHGEVDLLRKSLR